VALPKPVAGLIIRYSYLWYREHLEGRDEGQKGSPLRDRRGVLVRLTLVGRQTQHPSRLGRKNIPGDIPSARSARSPASFGKGVGAESALPCSAANIRASAKVGGFSLAGLIPAFLRVLRCFGNGTFFTARRCLGLRF
jgi:hypothetical protein